MKIKAAIFDMDGLLVDSERLFIDLYSEAARQFGYQIPHQAFLDSIGISSEETRRILFRGYGDKVPVDDIDKKFLEVFASYVNLHGLPVKAGALELIESFHEAGIKTAVATSNGIKNAEYLLGEAGLLEKFKIIVTKEM